MTSPVTSNTTDNSSACPIPSVPWGTPWDLTAPDICSYVRAAHGRVVTLTTLYNPSEVDSAGHDLAILGGKTPWDTNTDWTVVPLSDLNGRELAPHMFFKSVNGAKPPFLISHYEGVNGRILSIHSIGDVGTSRDWSTDSVNPHTQNASPGWEALTSEERDKFRSGERATQVRLRRQAKDDEACPNCAGEEIDACHACQQAIWCGVQKACNERYGPDTGDCIVVAVPESESEDE